MQTHTYRGLRDSNSLNLLYLSGPPEHSPGHRFPDAKCTPAGSIDMCGKHASQADRRLKKQRSFDSVHQLGVCGLWVEGTFQGAHPGHDQQRDWRTIGGHEVIGGLRYYGT